MRDIVARGEQGLIIVGNTSILQNIYLENINLTIDRWSNQSAHPSHDYRPSQEPQMAWASTDGIFASNIVGFDLRGIQIQFQEPNQDYYGQCLNLRNVTHQGLSYDVNCRESTLSSQQQIASGMWLHIVLITMLFVFI